MKKITRNVVALAMGLLLTVGATAQVEGVFTSNQNMNAAPAWKAAAPAMNGAAVATKATTSKVARVTATGDPSTTIIAWTFTMNDSCHHYTVLPASNHYMDNVADSDWESVFASTNVQQYIRTFSTDTVFRVQGYAPGDTAAIFIIAYENEGDATGEHYVYTEVLEMGGGTGTAVATIEITSYDATSIHCNMTINDQTSYYYAPYFDSTTIVGVSVEQIAANCKQRGMAVQTQSMSNASASDLTPGTTYAIFAIPFNGNNEMGTHDVKYVKLPSQQDPVAIAEALTNNLHIFPNPANGQINVVADGMQSVEIYNILGQRVMNQTVNAGSTMMNVESLSRGTYVVKVYTTDGVMTQKVVLQ